MLERVERCCLYFWKCCNTNQTRNSIWYSSIPFVKADSKANIRSNLRATWDKRSPLHEYLILRLEGGIEITSNHRPYFCPNKWLKKLLIIISSVLDHWICIFHILKFITNVFLCNKCEFSCGDGKFKHLAYYRKTIVKG